MNYGKLQRYTAIPHGICAEYDKTNLYVQFIEKGIVRFTTDLSHESYAVVLNHDSTYAFESKMQNGTIALTFENTFITLKDNMQIDVYEAGVPVFCDYTGELAKETQLTEEQKKLLNMEGHNASSLDNHSITMQKVLRKKDCIYGLGDKPGCLNNRGYSFINWNTDDPSPHEDNFPSLYKSIPFFIVNNPSYCYGVFADNTYRTTFDFGKKSDEYYSISHDNGVLDYYYISGNSIKEIVSRYTQLTGRATVLSKWLLGYHQSRWSYFSSEEVMDLAKNFKKYQIPCDCIHLDIDYMDGYRVFTFDKEHFPNPSEMMGDLKKQGIHIITIIDPGVKKDENYFVYQEGIKRNAFAKDALGNIYENTVWPGTSVYPDFTKKEVRDWWGENLKIMQDLGIGGIWNDMNEPASFNGPLPSDVQFEKGTHDEIHNVYGHLMAQATYEGLLKNDSSNRPFVLTRACYSGSQRYCGGWTGDNQSIWSHISLSLEQMCSLGMSGMMMVGSDIGGFGSDTTPELMVRFFEAALFSPFFRSHSAMGTKRQEPWCFDSETTDKIRSLISLRYRFIPYLYDLMYECVKTGIPILRPLVMEYPNDENVYNLSDEYMVGSFVLAAPITQPGKIARGVYLPAGKWYDYYTNECFEGDQYILANAPLGHLPIFVKAGALLPLCDKIIMNTGEMNPSDITIYAYNGSGSFTHIIDDGFSLEYRNGKYTEIMYTQNEEGHVETNIIHQGYNAILPTLKILP